MTALKRSRGMTECLALDRYDPLVSLLVVA